MGQHQFRLGNRHFVTFPFHEKGENDLTFNDMLERGRRAKLNAMSGEDAEYFRKHVDAIPTELDCSLVFPESSGLDNTIVVFCLLEEGDNKKFNMEWWEKDKFFPNDCVLLHELYK